MNARTSKIARLPLNLRDPLNHRLQNGDPGQPILDWLNQEPVVKQILAQWFNGQPINKQNLSDWRHGGYQDWLRHQSRQQNIQRIAEQGIQLTQAEGRSDLCESFSQIVIAEMAEELEHLHEITDRTERWQRLREISRELSRLQHGFNHSRSVGLAWNKYNDQFEDPPVNPSQPLSSGGGPIIHDANRSPSPPQSGGEGRGEEALSFTPAAAPGNKEQNDDPNKLNQQPTPPLPTIARYIYHRHCGRGCVCPHCHPEDGEYPYTQAVQDDRAHADHSSPYWNRTTHRLWITHVDCDCYCDCQITHPYPNQLQSPNALQTQPR